MKRKPLPTEAGGDFRFIEGRTNCGSLQDGIAPRRQQEGITKGTNRRAASKFFAAATHDSEAERLT